MSSTSFDFVIVVKLLLGCWNCYASRRGGILEYDVRICMRGICADIGAWVRVRTNPNYRGDIGRVVDVDYQKRRATVEVPPLFLSFSAPIG